MKVNQAIDFHGDVVLGNTGLAGYVKHLFLQDEFICHAIQEGCENMKAGTQRPAVFAKPLDDKFAFLGDDHGGFDQNDHDERGQHQCSNKRCIHEVLLYTWLVLRTKKIWRELSAYFMISTVFPASMVSSAAAYQVVPRY